MRRTVILSIFFLLFHNLARSQDLSKFYEQTAFDYFLDSVLVNEYPGVKVVYYDRSIGTELSLLRRPIGFEEYTKLKDSAQVAGWKRKIQVAQNLDLSMYTLHPSKNYGCDVREITPEIWRRKKWKKIMAVYLNKRLGPHTGFTIVELIAKHNYHRFHYFFEINEERNNVVRWYKTMVDI